MANGNTTASGIGQINAANDRRALFLKVFSGEVLTTYLGATQMLDKHMVRTITSGKSAQFPVIGNTSAKYHTPGQNVADADNSFLSSVKHNEKVIAIDGLCLSAVFISNIEDMMNHYDVRAEYSRQMGYALAAHFDRCVTNTVVAAARTSTPNISSLTGSGGLTLGGGQFFLGSSPTTANLIDYIFRCAAVLDRKDVPAEDRYVMLRPTQYYSLLQSAGSSSWIASSDWNQPGDARKGVVYEIAGMKVIKSNFLPSDDQSSGTLTSDSAIASENDVFGANGVGYGGNFSTTYGLVFHKSAVGTVKLQDLAVESEYQISRQGTLMVAKQAIGHGILRPECAIELRNTTGTDVNV